MPKPSAAKASPDPNAPGQTQFFMAAAGVSTGSMIKRILLFVLGALVVGTGIFLLIQYGFLKKDDPIKAKQPAAEPAVSAPALEADAEPAPAEPPGDPATAPGSDVPAGEPAPAAKDEPAPAKAAPVKAAPVKPKKKRKKVG